MLNLKVYAVPPEGSQRRQVTPTNRKPPTPNRQVEPTPGNSFDMYAFIYKQ